MAKYTQNTQKNQPKQNIGGVSEKVADPQKIVVLDNDIFWTPIWWGCSYLSGEFVILLHNTVWFYALDND